MTKDIRKRMADRHEAHVAELFGTSANRGSGNQWNRSMDGRSDSNLLRFAFAWDCKATLAKSVSVTEGMIDKAVRQAHHERSMVPIRFYAGERLTIYRDLALVHLDDLHEMWEVANGRSDNT